MDFNNLKMTLNDDGFLTPEENNALLKAYYELYTRMYGKDLPTSLIEVLKLKDSQPMKSKLLGISENYKMANKTLIEIKPNLKKNHLNMLMVYEKNHLIAAARIRNLGNDIVSIPDAVFMIPSQLTSALWLQMLEYLENYFRTLNYKKIYIEVPLNDPFLLKGCFNRDYQEDPEDIVVSEGTRTYFLNKSLERKR